MDYCLGVDLGTSSLQVVACAPDGQVIARAERQYPLLTPEPGHTQQVPLHWWAAFCAALREMEQLLGPLKPAAVGLSGQMHGMVATGAEGQALHDALLWNDQRTWRQADRVTREIGAEQLLRITGNPSLTGFQLPKLLWLLEEHPELRPAIRHVLLPKDWLRLQLTGTAVTEPSDASGTGIFDLDAGGWHRGMLEQLDLDPAWFPQVIPSAAVSGHVTRDAARATGLPEGTKVVAGAGDNAAANHALLVNAAGRGSLSLGTSGVLWLPVDQAEHVPGGRLHLFADAAGSYALLGVTLSAGGSLRWLRDTLLPDASHDRVGDLAAAAAPGSAGVVFHPYLSGERSPLLDPHVRGAFSGLSLASGLPEMVRAVYEGVAFSFRDVLDHAGPERMPTALLVTGGGARSAFWLQLLADVLEMPLERPATVPGAAEGAARLAHQAAGTDVRRTPWADETFVPQTDYSAAFARYLDMKPASSAADG